MFTDFLKQIIYDTPLRGLFSSIENCCLFLGISICGALFCYLAIRLTDIEDLDTFRRTKQKDEEAKKKKKKKKSSEADSELEKAILSILETNSDKEVSRIKLNNLTGKSLPMGLKVKKALVNLVHNPYNTTSIPKVLMTSCVTGAGGLMIGLLLSNVVAMISFAVLGFSIPLTLVSLQCLKRQLAILEGNLGLITTHLGIFRESPNLIDSFRGVLTILTPNTREYKAMSNAYKARTEANVNLEIVLDRLNDELLTDSSVKAYFDVCFIADTVSSEYKDALDYIPSRLQPIVSKNIIFVNATFYAYILYILIAFGVMAMMMYYRFFDPDTYGFLVNSTGGRVGSMALMLLLLAVGLLISKLAKVIRLE